MTAKNKAPAEEKLRSGIIEFCSGMIGVAAVVVLLYFGYQFGMSLKG